jgi:AcrR family transcriptional regulator
MRLDDEGRSFLERVVLSDGARVDDSDEITGRLLESARDLFRRVGVQRATMEDVARAAGYSRVTVYRRFASKDALVEQVIAWEFRSYLGRFLDDIKQARTVEDRVVTGFVTSLRAMRENSLIGGLLSAESGSVLASMVGEHGRTLATVRAFLAGQLRREQQAGNVARDLDVELVAEMMVRVSTSFLVTPSEIVDLDDEDQLARIARWFLVPMLTAPAVVRRRSRRSST